ncbi:hypothetical protein M9435_000412 [Picochlorum sp. BPE23]|nr:hypothetical protein M9435_000412 [Picochlorum sp. BPE23]
MGSVDDWAQGVVSRRSPPPPPSPLLTTSGTLYKNATYIDENTVQLTVNAGLIQGLVYWEGVLGYSWEASFDFRAGPSIYGADSVWFFAYREEIEDIPMEATAQTGYNFAANEYQNGYQLYAPTNNRIAFTGEFYLGDDTWRTMEITFSSDGTTDTIVMKVDGSQVIATSHVANPALKYLQPTYYGLGGRTGGGTNYHYVRNFDISRTSDPA